jgi:subtilisin family serine protease
MARILGLKIGSWEVQLERSETEIAVRPAAGQRRAFETQLRDLSERRTTSRRGTVGGFDIVKIKATGRIVERERGALASRAVVGDVTPVYYTSADRVPFVPAGSIYLMFEPGTPDARRQDIITKHGLVLARRERDGAFTAQIGRKQDDAVEVAAAIQTEAGVLVAEPDLISPKEPMQFQMPADELIALQWHLNNVGHRDGATVGFKQGADARVIAAWTAIESLGSPDAVIGIIDDGFDLSHPDLAGKAVSPWDFYHGSADVSPRPNLEIHKFGDWHGTACAGIACGSAEQGQIVGAAPMSKLIPVRSSPDIIPDEIVRCFDHMTDKGAWVVSCSWGPAAQDYPLSTRMASAMSRCANEARGGKGAVVAFAAGNSHRDINAPGTINGFATHPEVLAVSASTSRDEIADTSNFGASIAVCAPSFGIGGWRVTTSDVDGSYVDAQGNTLPMGYGDGAYISTFDGTSSSCPLVAGVCALVLSANPALGASEVRQIVKHTARRIGGDQIYGADGHSEEFGYGCINAEAAVKEAMLIEEINPVA